MSNDQQLNEKKEINIDTINVKLLIVVKNKQQFESISSFLNRRGWPTGVTASLNEAFQAIVEQKPDFVMVSCNHPSPKIAKFPQVIGQSFNIPCIAFGETADRKTAQKITASPAQYKMNGLVSGPSIHRQIKAILSEKYESKNTEKTRKSENKTEDESNTIVLKSSNKKEEKTFLRFKSDKEETEQNRKMSPHFSTNHSNEQSTYGADDLQKKLDASKIKDLQEEFLDDEKHFDLESSLEKEKDLKKLDDSSDDDSTREEKKEKKKKKGIFGFSLDNEEGNKEAEDPKTKKKSLWGPSASTEGREGLNLFGKSKKDNSDSASQESSTDEDLENSEESSKKNKTSRFPWQRKNNETDKDDKAEKKGIHFGEDFDVASVEDQNKSKLGLNLNSSKSEDTLQPDNEKESPLDIDLADSPEASQNLNYDASKLKDKMQELDLESNKKTSGQEAQDQLEKNKKTSDEQERNSLPKLAQSRILKNNLPKEKSQLLEAVEVTLQKVASPMENHTQLLVETSEVAVIPIMSKELNGYLVITQSKEEVKNQFNDKFKKELSEELKIKSTDINIDKMYNIKTNSIDFLSWADYISEFVIVKEHGSSEVGVFFYHTQKPLAELTRPSNDRQLINLDDISTSRAVDFKAQIYLKKNRKYFNYLNKGGVLSPTQKLKLKEMKHYFYIDVKDLEAFQNHYIGNVLDELINKFKNKLPTEKKAS